ncbi:cell division protein FtsZ [Brevundimonas aveniformis]|uniref:cell division protein FtsZ n=1 Tax=Brevundimonas aveniformis TaxID=370977 RepID=UPI002493371B|nr:cell division protein FtsZ [Brevundimonas aveniformis]
MRDLGLSAPKATELKPRIVVFGVGGAGGNAVNNMIEASLEGCDFVVANTDAQHLIYSKSDARIQLGATITQGLGAGAHPEVGMNAAEESEEEINAHLDGAHMVFITAGMGGGTGTGAAPVIARCARDRGILTVGVVTKPFSFEGRHRARLADAGIAELQRYVDTLIVIPNQNLFRIANEKTGFTEAFGLADEVLLAGVRSITDLMVLPGLINLDFADVRAVMSEMGKAMMGTGEATGEDRAIAAAQAAIQNPLLDDTSLRGAKAVLVNITGGKDMTLMEVDEAANIIWGEVDPEANFIFGAAFDPDLEGKLRVSVVATGMDEVAIQKIEPAPMRRTEAVSRTPVPTSTVSEPETAPTPEPIAIKAEETAAQPEPAIRRAQADLEIAARTLDPRQMVVETPAEPRIVARIVDPMVEDMEEQGDLYLSDPAPRTTASQPAPTSSRADDSGLFMDRREPPKRDRFSLFGRRKAEPVAPRAPEPARPAQQLKSTQQVEPTPTTAAVPEEDDLNIPAFLRRLAN